MNNRRCQVIYCRCGRMFAAMTEPECYLDSRWLASIKRYVNLGFRIDMALLQDTRLQDCACEVKPTSRAIIAGEDYIADHFIEEEHREMVLAAFNAGIKWAKREKL